MTKKDLEIMYRQETGEDIPTTDENNPCKLKDYIEWLENKVLSLYNLL